MSSKVRTYSGEEARKKYDEKFGEANAEKPSVPKADQPNDTDMRRAAFKHANEHRKFEIELYWKRATYFWTLVAATVVGYFVLLKISEENSDQLATDLGSFAVACLGLIFTLAWHLAFRGSKFWRENWENHVDLLEDDFRGPLYKTVLIKRNESVYSVSKLNLVLSQFVLLVWFIFVLFSLLRIVAGISDCPFVAQIGAYASMAFLFILTVYSGREMYVNSKKEYSADSTKLKQSKKIELVERETDF